MKRFLGILKSNLFRKVKYAKVEKAGGLSNALNIQFANINSSVRVEADDDLCRLPFTYTRIKKGNKLSQVYLAAEEVLYLPDFWREGVCLGYARTSDILDLATVIDFWLNHDVSMEVFAEKFSFVIPGEKAKAFDEGREVEYTWSLLLQDECKTELHAFIQLAANDEVLNKLFPFTSLYTLCFSRCTGYPYDTDGLPNVTPKLFENLSMADRNAVVNINTGSLPTNPSFVVSINKSEYLGEGNAAEALEIVRANLPDNIKPARKGTADD